MRVWSKKTSLIAALFYMLCLVSLSACGAEPCDSTESDSETNLLQVGFVQVGSESDWRVANSESIKKTLTQENGYELFFYDAKQKQENQIQAIRNFILQEMDYIILAPVVEDGWDEVLEEAKEAGIPVIIIDRKVNVKDDRLYTAWIGSDMGREAECATTWLDSYLESQGREEDEIHIVDIQGTLNSTAQIGRTRGLENAVAEHSNWKIIAQETADFTKAKAYEVMLNILKQTQDIQVVYCENDNEAFGVTEALEEAGISYGAGGQVIVISFDATKAGLEYCLSGKINLDIECNPLQGPRVDKVIRAIETGYPYGKEAYVNETFFAYDTLTQAVIDERAY